MRCKQFLISKKIFASPFTYSNRLHICTPMNINIEYWMLNNKIKIGWRWKKHISLIITCLNNLISSSCLWIYFRISSSCCAQQQRKWIYPSKMQTFRCLCDFSNLYLIEYCKRATDLIPNDKLLVYQWLLVHSIKIKIKYLFSPEL